MLDGFASSGDTVNFDYDDDQELISVTTANETMARTFDVEFGSGIEDVAEDTSADDFPAPFFSNEGGGETTAQAFA